MSGIFVLDVDDDGFTAWAPEIDDSVWFEYDETWRVVW